ncbi:energy transducer TonB [Mucilaginibacter sp.]|uniref:energy transducer TonB n=1 Tax=Mucilaginibacter sp. TaxID=1882438 RepID=UPI003D1286D5
MLISKFDLYKSEWLDLVFDNRNKEYGAYELRQHYASTMVKAMGITFLGISLMCGAVIVFTTVKPVYHIVEVVNKPIVLPQPLPPIKKIEKPADPKPLKAEAPAPAAPTTRDVPPVVVVDAKAEKPVVNAQIQGAIGTETTKGTGTAINATPVDPPGGTGVAPDESVHTLNGLDFMPEPVGGANAWAKFLSKNLRYPPVAQEEGVSGRVYLSFVIEKDGSLSNITVDRPAGHGFDEEALRVLKLAKAWKPGTQNGQPVRVKYTIPINFQVSE